MKIQAYEYNIFISKINGNKLLRKQSKLDTEKNDCKKQYNVNGTLKTNYIGNNLDIYI